MVNKARRKCKFFVGIDISKEWFDVVISAALIEGERSGLSARGPEDIRAAGIP